MGSVANRESGLREKEQRERRKEQKEKSKEQREQSKRGMDFVPEPPPLSGIYIFPEK
jgi:hypothetical protein